MRSRQPYPQCIKATCDDISNNSKEASFAKPVEGVVVQLSPSVADGVLLYVLWGTGTASATNWHFCLTPGDSCQAPPGVVADKVTLFSASALTYGSAVVATGWTN